MSKVIETNLKKIKERIGEACLRAGRNPEEVTLVAVSKTRSKEEIKIVRELGLIDFGENRVQELREKAEQLKTIDINWHMIGHLQRNKVKYLTGVRNFSLIHSLDSLRLAKEIEKHCRKNNFKMSVLIQVNTAGDKNKYGLKPEEVIPFIKKVQEFSGLKVMGLMTMAPFVEDPEEVRFAFRKLRELKEMVEEKELPGIEMKHLSMGMTNDFEVAVEEGSTLVRIGTGIFGPRR